MLQTKCRYYNCDLSMSFSYVSTTQLYSYLCYEFDFQQPSKLYEGPCFFFGHSYFLHKLKWQPRKSLILARKDCVTTQKNQIKCNQWTYLCQQLLSYLDLNTSTLKSILKKKIKECVQQI